MCAQAELGPLTRDLSMENAMDGGSHTRSTGGDAAGQQGDTRSELD